MSTLTLSHQTTHDFLSKTPKTATPQPLPLTTKNSTQNSQFFFLKKKETITPTPSLSPSYQPPRLPSPQTPPPAPSLHRLTKTKYLPPPHQLLQNPISLSIRNRFRLRSRFRTRTNTLLFPNGKTNLLVLALVAGIVVKINVAVW